MGTASTVSTGTGRFVRAAALTFQATAGWTAVGRWKEMLVKLTPQYNPNSVITYTFDSNRITATMDGVTDSFDFSKMSKIDLRQIKTTLPLNPIVQAERVDGELYVTLINYIKKEATETELFPDFSEV